MKKCLIISHVFPPSGGVGVQRVLKFVKYLGDFGWEPVVVTPRNPSVPLQDHSYEKDIPPGLAIYRLTTLDPGLGGGGAGERSGSLGLQARLRSHIKKLAHGLLFPDPQVVWLATALPGALAAARRHQVKAIMVSGPPFSPFLLGRLAAGILNIPLILDFRDDWSGFFSKAYAAKGGGRLWQALVRRTESNLVNFADRVIGNTPDMTRRLVRLYDGPPGKHLCIPNGYDHQDFAFMDQNPPAPPDDGRLHLMYTGTVFYGRPLDDLWKAMALLPAEKRQKAVVTIVGRAEPGQTLNPGLEGLQVTVLPYEPHGQVVRRMARAHVLVITLAPIPGLERMAPAKLFEYMAVRRTALALVPQGAASRIVEAAGSGVVAAPGNPQEVAEILRRWIDSPPGPLPPPPRMFDRRELTGQLARTLDEVADRKKWD